MLIFIIIICKFHVYLNYRVVILGLICKLLNMSHVCFFVKTDIVWRE